MDSSSSTLEKNIKERINYISAHLEDLYQTISELEQTLDLHELRLKALHNHVLVPLLGYLEKYDFDTDDNLVVYETGVMILDKLTCKEDIKSCKIQLGEMEKNFSDLGMEIFLPPFENYELEQFKEEEEKGQYFIPLVQVKTIPNKEISLDSSSDEEEEEAKD